MNLIIRSEPIKENQRHFSDYILPILTFRFGITSALIFLTLVITESYYKNIHTDGNSHFIGGLGSLIGFGFLFRAAMGAADSWKSYCGRCVGSVDCQPYFILTEEYIENGISGVWHQRFSWSMLSSFKENRNSFLLQLQLAQVIIKKRDLKDDQTINEIRTFFVSKQAAERVNTKG